MSPLSEPERSACEGAGKNLVGAKARMKSRYDEKVVRGTFDLGEARRMGLT